MGREKYKNMDLSRTTEFCIIGEKVLQNEILSSYLEIKTGRPCHIFKKINEFPGHHMNQGLVMVNCHSVDFKHMMIDLKRYNTRKKHKTHIIFFNVPTDMALQREFISHGVYGFFFTHDTIANFMKGIYSVMKGRLWFSREMMHQCLLEGAQTELPKKSIVDKLSSRQIEILSLLAMGASNQEISKKLFISPHTVKNHLYNIFKKIHVSNRIQASLWAAVHL